MKAAQLVSMGLVLAMALQVQAVFMPDYIAPPSPVQQSSNPTDADIIAALGITAEQLGGLLYKSDEGGGPFNTEIVKSEPPAGALTATLTYTGDPMPVTLTYIIVKDGKAGWTIWDASDWNVVDAIQVDNRDLWNPEMKALCDISHIAIYGTRVPHVPDGGFSFVLLGLGLLSAAGLKRIASP
jgi:hypothetical protein